MFIREDTTLLKFNESTAKSWGQMLPILYVAEIRLFYCILLLYRTLILICQYTVFVVTLSTVVNVSTCFCGALFCEGHVSELSLSHCLLVLGVF